jgi:hypothetical protein
MDQRCHCWNAAQHMNLASCFCCSKNHHACQTVSRQWNDGTATDALLLLLLLLVHRTPWCVPAPDERMLRLLLPLLLPLLLLLLLLSVAFSPCALVLV